MTECGAVSRQLGSLAVCVGRLGIVRGTARGHPRGDGAGAGLLGHAVVADDCVETPPRVGILGVVVRLQRSWDAALMLLVGGGTRMETYPSAQ